MLAVCAFRSCPFALAAHSGSLGHHERMVAEEVALSKDCVVQKWSRPANGTLGQFQELLRTLCGLYRVRSEKSCGRKIGKKQRIPWACLPER